MTEFWASPEQFQQVKLILFRDSRKNPDLAMAGLGTPSSNDMVTNVTNIAALATKDSLAVTKLWLDFIQTSSPDGRCDWIFFPNVEICVGRVNWIIREVQWFKICFTDFNPFKSDHLNFSCSLTRNITSHCYSCQLFSIPRPHEIYCSIKGFLADFWQTGMRLAPKAWELAGLHCLKALAFHIT